MKFQRDDKFTLGGLAGTVLDYSPGTYQRTNRYLVQFEGHTIDNWFTTAWFEAHATKIEPPKPDAREVYASLEPGTLFQIKTRNGKFFEVWKDNTPGHDEFVKLADGKWQSIKGGGLPIDPDIVFDTDEIIVTYPKD